MFRYLAHLISYDLKANLYKLYAKQNRLPKLIEGDDVPVYSIDDYYVKLLIISSEENQPGINALRKTHSSRRIINAEDADLVAEYLNYKKQAIEVESLFATSSNNKKILVIGKAGTGKTTLMHYISYKWGKHELWNEAFDYVLRVRLKELTNLEWKLKYTPSQLRNNVFACFLHHCLGEDRKHINVKELIKIIRKDSNKMLLLLDGYDEITHLVNSGDNDINEIMDRVFVHPNLIMTSRPNAISNKVKEIFDSKVENIGLDEKGIKLYIKTHFKEQAALAQELWEFLEANQAIKEICATPINMQMVCLIWSHSEMKTKLNSGTSISSLYHDIICWMGRRYIDKFEKDDAVDMSDTEILSHPIVLFTNELGYLAFDSGKLIIDKKLIINILEKYKPAISSNLKIEIGKNIMPIRAVNKFGILKPEGNAVEIIDQDHSFIHLTFQEWMCAYYVKKQIISDNFAEVKSAKQFISRYSDDPRYLMTMKFLTGLLSNMEGDIAQIGINRFWEAIISSNNEIIKVPGVKQIELLMHLLPQARYNGKIDPRVPSGIYDYIDKIILNDISGWEEQLIESHYSSLNIINKLFNNLISNNKKDFIQSAKLLPYLNLRAFGLEEQVTDILTDKLNDNDMEIVEASLYGVSKMSYIKKGMEALLKCLDDEQLNVLLIAIDLLGKMNVPYLLPKILKKLDNSNSWIVIGALEAIGNIGESGNEIKDILVEKLGDRGVNKQIIANKVLETLSKLGYRKKLIIDELLEHCNSAENINKKINSINALVNIASDNPKVMTNVFKLMNNALFNLSLDTEAKLQLLRTIDNMLLNSSEENILEIIRLLLAKITDSNIEVNKEAKELLHELREKIPKTYSLKIFKFLFDQFSQSDDSSLSAIMMHLVEIVPEDQLSSMSEFIISKIKSVDKNVSEKAMDLISDFVKANGDKISTDQAVMVSKLLIKKLGSSSSYYAVRGIENIWNILPNEKQNEMLDVLIVKALDKIEAMATNAIEVLSKLNFRVPNERIEEIWTVLIDKNNDSNEDIAKAAIEAIEYIGENAKDIEKVNIIQVIEALIIQIAKISEVSRGKAKTTLYQLINQIPERQIVELIDSFLDKIIIGNKEEAAISIKEVVDYLIGNLPETIKPEVIKTFFLKFNNENEAEANKFIEDCINYLVNRVSENKVAEVIKLLFAFAVSENNLIKTLAEESINKIIAKISDSDLVLGLEVDDVFEVLIAEIKSTKPEIKQLAIRNVVSGKTKLTAEKSNKITQELIKLIEGRENSSIKLTAIEALNKLDVQISEKILESIYNSNEADLEVLALVSAIMINLNKNNQISASKLNELLEFFLNKIINLNDELVNTEFRVVLIYALLELQKKISFDKIIDILEMFFNKLTYNDYNNKNAALILIQAIENIVSNIENSQVAAVNLDEIVELLLDKAKDQNIRVSFAAMQAMKHLKAKITPCKIPKILEIISHKIADNRALIIGAAIEVINSISSLIPENKKPSILELLLEKVREEDFQISTKAIKAIVNFRDQPAFEDNIFSILALFFSNIEDQNFYDENIQDTMSILSEAIPETRIIQALELFILYSSSEHEFSKELAIKNIVSIHSKIPENKLLEVLEILFDTLTDGNNFIESIITKAIGKIIDNLKNEQALERKLSNAIELVISKINEQNNFVSFIAMQTINGLQDKIPEDKIEDALDAILDKLDKLSAYDSFVLILQTIDNIVYLNNKIPENKKTLILERLLEKAKKDDSIISIMVINAAVIFKDHSIFETNVIGLIELFFNRIEHLNSLHPSVLQMMGNLCESVPGNQITQVLELFLTKSNDQNESVKLMAIEKIGSLYNKIPQEKFVEMLEVFFAKAEESSDEIRSAASRAIEKLVTSVSEENIIEILELLFAKAIHDNKKIQKISEEAIDLMIKNVSTNKYSSVLNILILKIRSYYDDDVRNHRRQIIHKLVDEKLPEDQIGNRIEAFRKNIEYQTELTKKMIDKLIDKVPVDIIGEIVEFCITKLADLETDSNSSKRDKEGKILEAIYKLTENIPQSQLSNNILEFLMVRARNDYEAIKALEKISSILSESKVMEFVELLFISIKTEDTSYRINLKIETLGKISSILPESKIIDAIEILFTKIREMEEKYFQELKQEQKVIAKLGNRIKGIAFEIIEGGYYSDTKKSEHLKKSLSELQKTSNEAIIKTLADVKEAKALEIFKLLIDKAQDKSIEVRKTALLTLSELENKIPEDMIQEIIDLFIKSARDQDKDIRYHTIKVLNNLATKIADIKLIEVIEALVENVTDIYSDIRKKATKSLQNRGAGMDEYDLNDLISLLVNQKLGNPSPEKKPKKKTLHELADVKLIEYLKSDSILVRLNILNILQLMKYKNEKIIEILEKTLLECSTKQLQNILDGIKTGLSYGIELFPRDAQQAKDAIFSMIELLHNLSVDINHKNDEGDTALIIAAQKGHTKLVELLINKGVNIDQSNNYGYTALMAAAYYGYVDIVKLLIKTGANPNTVTTSGITHVILKFDDHNNIVLITPENQAITKTQKILYDNRAYTEGALDEKKLKQIISKFWTNQSGSSALIFAACGGHTEICNLLIKAGALVNHVSSINEDALMGAAYFGQLSVCKLLIQYGADTALIANKGDTALAYAEKGGYQEIVTLIQQNLPDAEISTQRIDQIDNQSENSHVAAGLLLKLGSKLDSGNKNEIEDLITPQYINKLLENKVNTAEALDYIAEYIYQQNADIKLSKEAIAIDSKKYILIGDIETRLNYLHALYQAIQFKYQAKAVDIFVEQFSFNKEVEQITSVINVDYLLSTDTWRLSILVKYNNQDTNIYTIILFEKKSIFGDVLIQKFSVNEGLSEFFVISAEEINKNFNRMLFGKPAYENKNTFYHINSFIITQDEKENILEGLSNNGQLNILEIVVAALNNRAYIKQNLVFIQNEYSELNYQIEMSHYELVGYNDIEVIIDEHGKQLTEQSQGIKDLKDRVIKIETKLKQDSSILTALIHKEQLAEEEQKELDIIEADLYKFSFYQALRCELNSFYLASSAIHSDMVANQSQDIIGNLGSFIETISYNIPLIGVGAKIFGQVLQGIDTVNQKEKVENYLKIAVDSKNMAEIAEYIARKIALASLKITSDQSILSQAGDNANNAISAANYVVGNIGSSILATGKNIMRAGVADIVASGYSNIKNRVQAIKDQIEAGDKPHGLIDYAKRFIQGPQIDPNDPQTLGETDASIVAELVIQKIFAGKYKAKPGQVVKTQYIKERILESILITYSICSQDAKEMLETNQKEVLFEDEDLMDEVADLRVSNKDIRINKPQIRNIAQVLPFDIVDDKANAEVANLMQTSLNIEQQVKREERIAIAVLERYKLLIDALDLNFAKPNIVDMFLNDLSNAINHHNDLFNGYSETDFVNLLAKHLKNYNIISIQEGKIDISTIFATDIELLNNAIRITKEELSIGTIIKPDLGCIVCYVTELRYDNLILNEVKLLQETSKLTNPKIVNQLIELGKDKQVAEGIIDVTRQYDVPCVLNVLFDAMLVSKYNKLISVQAVTKSEENIWDIDKVKLFSFKILSNSLEGLRHIFINSNINWLFKKIYYYRELSQFNELLQSKKIYKNIEIINNPSEFRKILLKLHPDKGGNSQDFIFVKNLQEKLTGDLDLQKILEEKIQAIQPIIYKAGIGFRILDTIIDGARFIHEPTTDHAKKVVIDSTYIYSMCYGVNGYSTVISTTDVLYKITQGDFTPAFQQAATTAGFMALPTMLTYTGIPYIGFIYSTVMTAYSGYSAISNVYSFYLEYTSESSGLKSFTAYRDFFKAVSYSPLQYIYDFSKSSREYEFKMNNINLELEKTQIKQQLEANGEFGQKLYDYFYLPFVEEKYALLDKIAQGIITLEEAKTIKAKHIQVATENIIYDHCIEIVKLKDERQESDHYYCYNEEQQIIDHVLIDVSGKYIEVVGRI